MLVTPNPLGPTHQALRLLAHHEARAYRLPPSPLRTIQLSLIGDGKRGLSGESGWQAAKVRQMADLVLSGRFGQPTPGVGGS